VRHSNLARRQKSCLLVVDVQDRVLRALYDPARVAGNCRRLVEGARILGVPILVTTQNAPRLGPTTPELAEALGEFEAFDKMAFSCCDAEGFMDRLDLLEKDTVIVCGMEAHVCVLQTVLDLVENGYRVHVVADAVSSRTPENRQAALEKMRQAGALLTTTEILLFELLRTADAPEFKAVQALIK